MRPTAVWITSGSNGRNLYSLHPIRHAPENLFYYGAEKSHPNRSARFNELALTTPDDPEFFYSGFPFQLPQ